MKAAAALLIRRLFKDQIKPESFNVDDVQTMATRDDVWLWSLLREARPTDRAGKAAWNVLLWRDKSVVTSLWRRRTEYEGFQEKLRSAARVQRIEKFDRKYERWLSKQWGSETLVFWLKFQPIGNARIALTTGDGEKETGELLEASTLVRSLIGIWQDEPQYHVVVLGEGPDKREELGERWVELTAEWLWNHGEGRAAVGPSAEINTAQGKTV